MYLQARVFIRTALAQLVAAVLLGALLQANVGLHLSTALGTLLPVYYHLLMLGWATQLIAGVALWMFPPLTRERPRGDERLGWLAYGALNGGLALRAVAEPLHALAARPWTAFGLVVAALLQVVAVWSLVIALWPRVKGKAEPPRRGGS